MSEKSTTKITRPHLSRAPSVNQLCWFIFAILVAHVIEELPRFPEWATRHFGTTTTGFFILSHIPLLVGAYFIVYRSSKDQKNGIWISLAVLLQWALFVNGLFHIATTLAFGEYSPGVVTAVILYVPFTIYLLKRIIRDGYLSHKQVVGSCARGTVLAASMIGSLWLETGFI
jgi:hypothetical protein